EDLTVPRAGMAIAAAPPPPADRLEDFDRPGRTPTAKGEKIGKRTEEYLIEGGLGRKPKTGSSGGLVLALRLALIFGAFGAGAALFWPQLSRALGLVTEAKEASIEIRTTPAQALLYLDDAKLKDVSPAKITGLKPGVPYSIKIVKDGFFPENHTVTIDP